MDIKADHPRNWNVSTALDSRKGVYSGVLNATLSGFTPMPSNLASQHCCRSIIKIEINIWA